MAVFTYFASCLFGRQFLLPNHAALDNANFPNATSIPYAPEPPFDEHTPGFVIPVSTLIELVCHMGWVKVAESLLNPFGG